MHCAMPTLIVYSPPQIEALVYGCKCLAPIFVWAREYLTAEYSITKVVYVICPYLCPNCLLGWTSDCFMFYFVQIQASKTTIMIQEFTIYGGLDWI